MRKFHWGSNLWWASLQAYSGEGFMPKEDEEEASDRARFLCPFSGDFLKRGTRAQKNSGEDGGCWRWQRGGDDRRCCCSLSRTAEKKSRRQTDRQDEHFYYRSKKTSLALTRYILIKKKIIRRGFKKHYREKEIQPKRPNIHKCRNTQ